MTKHEKVVIVDSGVIGSESQVHAVITDYSQGCRKAIVAENVDTISHWYLIEKENGDRVMYFGTEESFLKNCGQ